MASFHCAACDSYFPEHHGHHLSWQTVAVELIVRVLACLAEGLGIRATARGFEVDPNTVLQWLVKPPSSSRRFQPTFSATCMSTSCNSTIVCRTS